MADAPPPYPISEKGGYPPQYTSGQQQSSYPPQQSGYPPQQGGYPPQQGGYPPQQVGYPPQQGGYPPQQGGYPPQQGGYPPQQGGPVGYAPIPTQQTVVVQTQPMPNIVIQRFHESPLNMQCPRCNAQIITGTQYEVGTCAWVACLGICLIGCDAGCCFIPFCVDACKDVVHTCPNCHSQIGRYNRL